MDFLRFARVVRQSLGFLMVATLVGAALGAGVGWLGDRQGTARPPAVYYSATETLGYDASAAGGASDGPSTLATIGGFVTGPVVTDEVGKKLGADGVTLARQITTVARPTTSSVDVSAVADSAARAERIAKAFSAATMSAYAEELISRSTDQATQLSKRLDDLKARRVAVAQQMSNPNLSAVDRDTLNAQSDALVNQYRIAYDRFINLASPDSSAPPLFTLALPAAVPIDEAAYRAALERGRTGQNHIVAGDATSAALSPASSSDGSPSGPVPLGIVGALLGFAVGIGVLMVRARFDSKLRTRLDFEEAYALPILGGVPTLARDELARHCLAVIEKPYSPGAEVFRSVRSALLLLGTDNSDRDGALIVMISSAEPKEGKSASCANLAAAFAESGRSVLAINCDYRRPTLHRYFGLPNEPGRVLATEVQGLSVVTNGPNAKTSPGRIAAEQRAFIEMQRAHFDVILLDTAPLLSTSDPIDIVSVADFVLLIGRPGSTERDHAHQTMELLARHRVDTAGLLLTSVDIVSSDYYYYYDATYASSGAPADAEPRDVAGAPDPELITSPTQPLDQQGRTVKHRAGLRWRSPGSQSNGH
jgi:Mrp family chromosome partitioning ATPase/capsular polysaccharide biosynthesis protein